MKTQRTLVCLAALATLALMTAGAPPAREAVDPSIPRYQPPKELAGLVRIIGSWTVCSRLAHMGDSFPTANAKVQFEVKGGATSTALPALLDGSADLAAVNRQLTPAEKAQFKDKFGYEPTEILVGLDALAIYVNKENPIASLTFADLAELFGDGSKGHPTAKQWGEVGLTDKWESMKVVAYGFRLEGGASTMLRDVALDDAGFRSDLKAQVGATGVVSAIGAELGGVGYASQSYRSKSTKIVPLAKTKGSPAIAPTRATVLDGSYPFGRHFYVYVNLKHGTPLPAATLEFLKFVLSRDGQEVAAKEGGFPLPANLANGERAKLD